MIDRNEALILLNNYLQDDKLLKHSFAVEAIMKKLAIRLKKNVYLWSIVGLLHDIDYEYTIGKPENHGILSEKILIDLIPTTGINAIKAHNYIHTDQLPISTLDKALLASDSVSGLIIATALVTPNKKLNKLRSTSIEKKFKDPSFAKGCDRNRINLCEDIGVLRKEFFQLSLQALQEISEQLGL